MKSNHLTGNGALVIAGFFLLLGSVANAAPTGKIEICHKPGERSQRILVIKEKVGPAHFGHGDYVVTPEVCDGMDSDCDTPIHSDNDVDCSDGIACTVDSCAGLPGCFNTPDDLLCNDGDASTTDVCDVSVGGCVSAPVVVATVDILGGCAVHEGDSIKFTLRLDRPVPSSVTVNLALNGSGDDPATLDDFNAAPNVVVIAPNEVVTYFDVITTDDLLFEPTEAFEVRIQGVSSPHIIGTDSAGGSIFDNDQPICGNGIVEAPEQCDDGNTQDGDGCSAACGLPIVGADQNPLDCEYVDATPRILSVDVPANGEGGGPYVPVNIAGGIVINSMGTTQVPNPA
jgi:cysteine-rich repeat protein